MAFIQERKSQDGKVSYRVQVRLKGYPTETATFKRKTDAKNWAANTESAIREGRHFKTTEAKKHTLGDLIDRYIRDELPKKSAIMIRQKHQLNWWKEQIGVYPYRQSPDMILTSVALRPEAVNVSWIVKRMTEPVLLGFLLIAGAGLYSFVPPQSELDFQAA